jgi:hypothetical protein
VGKDGIMAWAEEEFPGADLGDKRLNRRLIQLTERFADKPTPSIPGACADRSVIPPFLVGLRSRRYAAM